VPANKNNNRNGTGGAELISTTNDRLVWNRHPAWKKKNNNVFTDTPLKITLCLYYGS